MSQLWVALDVDFLLSLQMGEENSATCIDLLAQRGGYSIATPSVLQQLADMAKNGKDEALCGAAKKTLQSLATWNVVQPSLDWKKHALAEAAAKKIVDKGLCASYQRALVLAEGSVTDSRLLLTYNPSLTGIDPATLTLLLVENHIPDCTPMLPLWFATWFKDAPKTS